MVIIVKIGIMLRIKRFEEECTNDSGQSRLYLAVEAGDIDTIHFLLANGVDPTDGLLTAVSKNNEEMVMFLIEKGADLTGKGGGWDTTPLLEAARLGHVEAARALLVGGADINKTHMFQCQDPFPSGLGMYWEYESPLSVAIRFCRPEMVKFLLRNGANRETCTGKYGYTMLQQADQMEVGKIEALKNTEVFCFAKQPLHRPLIELNTVYGLGLGLKGKPREEWGPLIEEECAEIRKQYTLIREYLCEE